MNATVEDLRPTIIPKSDQLNAEQLLGGPMDITVTEVAFAGGKDQPVVVHYADEQGRPYKPCKTMRKVLIYAWGENGTRWVGRSMRLYNDPSVTFGGDEVGGIRISHLSHIDKVLKASLTSTRGKKSLYTVYPMPAAEAQPTLDQVLGAINAASNRDEMRKARELAERLRSPDDVSEAQGAYKARVALLKKKDSPDVGRGKPLQHHIDAITAASSAETASLVLDDARDTLSAEDFAALSAAYSARWEAGA